MKITEYKLDKLIESTIKEYRKKSINENDFVNKVGGYIDYANNYRKKIGNDISNMPNKIKNNFNKTIKDANTYSDMHVLYKRIEKLINDLKYLKNIGILDDISYKRIISILKYKTEIYGNNILNKNK